MRATQRERELRALLRVSEDGAHNLADFIAEHGAELGFDAGMRSEPDEVLSPLLRAHLERLRTADVRAGRSNVEATLRQLRMAARWHDGQALLPPAPLFRLCAPGRGKKYIRFVGPGVDVTVRRQLLQRAGVALRAFRDVSAIVDADGMHFRWDARGTLNFYSENIKPAEDTLVVSLPARCAPTRLPALLGEIIAELGFGA